MFLSIQRQTGGSNNCFACLLNVPFVQSGYSHGNTLPAEAHSTFNVQLAAHVEGPDLWEMLSEGGDGFGIDTGTYQNFRALARIPQLQKRTDDFHALQTAAGCTAGKNSVNPQLFRI
jgi:hypothetical protein